MRSPALAPLILFCAACRSPAADLASVADTARAGISAQSAPAVLADLEYGLAGDVPAGMFYCRRADDFQGSVHGRIVYFSPPAACDPSGSAAGRDDAAPPGLTLYYSFNTAEFDYPDGFRPPRSAEELASRFCHGAVGRLPGVILLAAPHSLRGGDRRSSRYQRDAPYYLDGMPDAIAPNSELGVRLATTRARLQHDWPFFARLAASVHLCTTPWQRSKSAARVTPSRANCPTDGAW